MGNDKVINFASVCNEAFAPGLQVLLYSLKKHHDNFEYYVIDDGMTDATKIEISSIYDVKYVSIDKERYASGLAKTKTLKHIKPSFYSIEVFNLKLDHVIQLDTDMLCFKSIRGVFEKLQELGTQIAVTDLFVNNNFNVKKAGQPRTEFSAGFMYIGELYLNNTTYEKLISMVGECEIHPFGDQPIYNEFFKNKDVMYISNRLNGYKRFFSDNKSIRPDVVRGTVKQRLEAFNAYFIHYAGIKPWLGVDTVMDTYKYIEKIWHDVKGEIDANKKL